MEETSYNFKFKVGDWVKLKGNYFGIHGDNGSHFPPHHPLYKEKVFEVKAVGSREFYGGQMYIYVLDGDMVYNYNRSIDRQEAYFPMGAEYPEGAGAKNVTACWCLAFDEVEHATSEEIEQANGLFKPEYNAKIINGYIILK